MADSIIGSICDDLDRENLVRWFGDEDAPDFMHELKVCAWRIIRENPGIDCSEWIYKLNTQYPSEVVDALGVDPPEVMHQLTDLWEWGEYEDKETGVCQTFSAWAETFATDRSVSLYNLLEESKRENRQLRSKLEE